MKGNCVIIDFVRSPLCAMGGDLKTRTVDQLGQSVLAAMMAKTGMDPQTLEHVIMGHAHMDTDPYNMARMAWLLTQISEEVPAYSVNACGASGLLAMQKAYYLFKTGNDLTAIVGGGESYSYAPFILRKARYDLDLDTYPVVDSIKEGEQWTQPNPMNPRELAKKLAEEKGYSPEMLESLVAEEQKRMDETMWEGHTTSVTWLDRKKNEVVMDKDAFAAAKDGYAAYVDGAVAMLVSEEERAAELGLKPIGRVLGFASAASAPDNRWESAVKAVAKLCAKNPEIDPAALTDIEVIADSAASTLAITEGLKELGFQTSAINPTGSSLVYGINEGGDGVLATGRCLLNLRKTGARYGIITAAMAGGQAMAMLVEAI